MPGVQVKKENNLTKLCIMSFELNTGTVQFSP